jgi:AraC-like DNA-binding protein
MTAGRRDIALTPMETRLRQIERARKAVELLQRGTPIPIVVHEAGYSDQPHLTKSLRRFIGQTPGQVLAASVPEADPAAIASHRTHW